jgi:acyl-CoA synthetase (AMP-forming)/AMP-acid ligase II
MPYVAQLDQTEHELQRVRSVGQLNLADVFVGLGRRWPDRQAIVSPRLSLTYGQLVARASQAARELKRQGVRAETKVGIILRDGAETIVSMIALWMLRATAVPIDFRANAEERSLLAQEFGFAATIEDRPMTSSGQSSIIADAGWSEAIARHSAEIFFEDDSSQAPALISVTSGTTGRPVGLVMDHERVLLRSLCDATQKFGTLLLNPLSVSFSASRTHTFAALVQGVGVYFQPAIFSADELVETILSRGATSLCAVPTIVRNLFTLASGRAAPLFTGLDAFLCLGAPMRAEEKTEAKALLSPNFIQEYGASIVGRISSLSGQDLDARPDSVGRVLPQVRLQVVDDDDNPITSPGETGTIRLRAPGMALGVEGFTRETGDKLKGGWAYPGDVGALDEQGFLTLAGRSSDLIIRGGINVHPSEIESVLAEYPGIRDVAAVGFPTAREGEEIAVFVVPAAELSESALIGYCRARLSPDKRPRRFVYLNELPRNANGKVLRGELRKLLQDEQGATP